MKETPGSLLGNCSILLESYFFLVHQIEYFKIFLLVSRNAMCSTSWRSKRHYCRKILIILWICWKLEICFCCFIVVLFFMNIFRFFRVIPAETYLAEFASDRRHMRRPDGTWIKPPPSYPPIQTSSK